MLVRFIRLLHLGILSKRAGCKDRLPKKMRKNSNCRKLRLSCKKLENKCKNILGKHLGNSQKARKCRTALKGQAKAKVNAYCKSTCKNCGNSI